MEVWQSKDKTILEIYQYIIDCLGRDYFTLPNFWDGDNFAIGLKRDGKLIYISTWDSKEQTYETMEYYSEFEIVDEETLKTIRTERRFQRIRREELVSEIKKFCVY